MIKAEETISNYQFSDDIDWQRLGLVSMGDPEYQVDLLKMFVERAKTYVAEIARAIAENNCEDVVNFSHKLKGISAHLGLRKISEVTTQLESRGTEDRLEDAELLLERLGEILGEVKALLAFLHTQS